MLVVGVKGGGEVEVEGEVEVVGPGVPPSEGKGILETLLSLREGRTISYRLSIG